MPPITLQELAARLKVSKATVSRALRDNPRISESVRRRVRQLADEHGYRPNPVVSALAQSRWQATAETPGATVAYVINDSTNDLAKRSKSSGRYRGILAGMRTEAGQRGYGVGIFNLQEYGSAAALNRVLLARGIRGLVLGPVYENKPELNLEWQRFSTVTCQPAFFPLPFHRVHYSPFDQVRAAFEQIRGLGYRRIGFVLYQHSHAIDDDIKRFAAVHVCAETLAGEGGELPWLRLKAGDSIETHSQQVAEWFRWTRPQVVVGFTGAIRYYLEQAGFEAPRDFAFASLHVDAEPDTAGIRITDRRLGEYALRFLDLMLRGNEVGIPSHPIIYHIDFEWVSGGSLPRPQPTPKVRLKSRR